MSEQLDRKKFVALLKKSLKNRDSGTLIVRGEDGHSNMLVFDHGQIIAISHNTLRGNAALTPLCALEKGHYSFNNLKLGYQQKGIPDTRTIINAIEMGFGDSIPETAPNNISQSMPVSAGQQHKAKVVPPTRPIDLTAIESKKQQHALSQHKLIWILSNLLTPLLGPIAPKLCQAAVRKANLSHPDGLDQLILSLADDIPEESEQMKFVENANAQILQMNEHFPSE